MTPPPGQAEIGRVRSLAHRAMLMLYPRRFRRRFGDEMLTDYALMAAQGRSGIRPRLVGWWQLVRDAVGSAPRERVGRSSGSLGASSLRNLPAEFRSAWRGVRTSPGLAWLVVLTLALGIGPTTAVYSLANWLLLRPVPGVTDSERLGTLQFGRHVEGGFSPEHITYANLGEFLVGMESLERLGGTQGGNFTVLLAEGDAEPFDGEFVTPRYFAALGVRPRFGRLLDVAEDDPVQGGASVALVSYRLAQARFGDAEDAVGATMTINRYPFEIVGVLPAGFHGAANLGRTDLWLPGASMFRVRHFSPSRQAADRADGSGYYEFVARRAPGSTWEQVGAELESRVAAMREQYPEDNDGLEGATFLVYPGVGYPPLGREPLARTLWLLGAVAGCVLLVACANVSNLLSVRAFDRRGQVAVQKALGTSAARLARQGLFEGLILSASGALLGTVLAAGMLRAFEGAQLGGMFQAVEGVQLDARVGRFVALLCVGVTLAASVLPAIRSARLDPAAWLARAALTGTDSGWRWRGALSIVQVAAGVPLVLGALLFGATLAALHRQDLGFQPGTVRVLTVNPADQGYDPARALLYQRQLLDALQADPAIARASVSRSAPFVSSRRFTRLALPGSEAPPLEPQEVAVTAAYFDMLAIPLLEGRTFREDEAMNVSGQGAEVVVLSAALARRLFAGGRAVDRFVEFPVRSRAGRPYRVIGVVGDVRYQELDGSPTDTVYVPLGSDAIPWVTVLVDGPDPAAARAAAVAAGAKLDPLLPVVPDRRTPGLADGVRLALSERALLVRLFMALAGIALLLAAAGTYGAASRMVAARGREIGLRMALGASVARVFRNVIAGSLVVAVAGSLGGAALAAFGVRLIESRLFGVSSLDPLLWAAALLGPVLLVLVAAVPSARRAASTDPAAALRG